MSKGNGATAKKEEEQCFDCCIDDGKVGDAAGRGAFEATNWRRNHL